MNYRAIIIPFIDIVIGALTLNLMVTVACAKEPIADTAELALPIEMSDDELANMRGRYVDAGKIVYFTLQMTTQWTDGIGQVVGSGLKLGVPAKNTTKRNDQRIARLQTLYKNTTANSSNPGKEKTNGKNNSFVSSQGLNDVNGLTQSIQVAGDGNTVNNAVRMEVLTRFAGQAETASPTTNASSAEDNWEVVESVDNLGSQSIVTESGAVLGTQVERSKIGVSVDIPGIGKAVQQIRAGNLEELNGLLQSVQLAGDQQQVQNRLDLQTVFQQSSDNNASYHITPALQSLMGLQMQR